MENKEKKELVQKESKRLWKRRSFKFSVLTIILFLSISIVHLIRTEYRKIICKINLCYGVHYGFHVYSNDYEDKLPPLDAWNDLLIEYADMTEKAFHCPASKSSGLMSDYSINKNLPVSAWTLPSSNMVFAFESVPGWNQAGDSDIFNFANHKSGGYYNTLSSDEGYYIRPEEVNQLKWRIEE